MLQPKTKETKLIPNDELDYKLSVVSEESSQSGGEIPIMEDVFLESISIYDNPNDLQLREEAKIAEKNKVFKAKKRALILEHIDGEIEGQKDLPSRADMNDNQRRDVKKAGKNLENAMLVGTGSELLEFDENMMIQPQWLIDEKRAKKKKIDRIRSMMISL